MGPIRVVVHGALGRVGQEVVKAVCREPDTQLVGVVDLKAAGDSLSLPDGSGTVPFSNDLDFILTSWSDDTSLQRGVFLVLSHHLGGHVSLSAPEMRCVKKFGLTISK